MNRPNSETRYLRASVRISEHPAKPLEGKRWALTSNTATEPDIDGEILANLIDEADKRFEIEAYAKDLGVAIVYFDAENRKAVAVSWEEKPMSYRTKKLSDPVSALPDDTVPIEQYRDED